MVNVIKLFKSYRNFLKPLCQYVSYCRLFVSFLMSLPFNYNKGNVIKDPDGIRMLFGDIN